jgi:molybdate transport system ATP-binding protein
MQITFSGVSLKSGGQPFIEDLDWRIAPGERWAVVGTTGAGKSLLAQVIQRRVPCNRGQILYAFEEGSRPRPFLHPGEVALFSAETHRDFLGQFAGYVQARWHSLEGEDNPTVIDYLMATRKTPAPDHIESLPIAGHQALLTSLINLMGLDPILERQVHLLSNGESRKVFLVHLLLQQPSLLILDDPFNGLDSQYRANLASSLDSLMIREAPVLLICASRADDLPAGVTHCLVLEAGRVTAKGPKSYPAVADALVGLSPRRQETPLLLSPTKPDMPEALRRAAVNYATNLAAQSTRQPAILIELRGATVTYNGVRVIDNINWKVWKGQRWLLSGANGAGKSTLLSLLLADNPQAYANPVYLFGRRLGDGTSIWEIRRAFGWVSPEMQAFYARPSLDHPPYTLHQVVASGFFDSIGLYHHLTPTQKKTAEGWIEAFTLTELNSLLFTRLSSGQQRLALLARALVKHPTVLVLDEPCQALDASHRQAFTAFVDALCTAAPLTLIYVTHDPAEVPACITHTLRLEHGRATIGSHS